MADYQKRVERMRAAMREWLARKVTGSGSLQ